jgi:hypothetical protein
VLSALVSTGRYLALVVPAMVGGVVLANLLVSLGLLERLAWVTRPIIRLGHLNDVCGLSFITAFASPAAANTMLVDQFRQGTIPKRELYVASLANSFPAIVMHWRSMLPVAVPLLGIWGLAYFGILAGVGLVKTVLILAVGRVLLPRPANKAPENRRHERPRFSVALRISLHQSSAVVLRLLKITVPVTWATFCLVEWGLFDRLTQWMAGWSLRLPLPPEGLGVVAAKFANHVAAYTIASNLLAQGLLDGRQLLVVLLVADILASITGLRFLIPYYLGIYGPRLGTELMILSTVLRQGLIFAVVLFITAGWG